MKVLVAGWFSFQHMGATAGDLMCRDLVCQWLDRERIPYEVAVAEPFLRGIAWETADPRAYSHVVFVCGPFGNGPPVNSFLERFRSCRLLGLNLSMLQDVDQWNPFQLLWERDSSRDSKPDLVFLAQQPRVPVVGTVLVHHQAEYGRRGRHDAANEAIHRLLDSRHVARVRIDTRLDDNQTGLRTAQEVESLIARMDVVVTTRLHGTVLSLKNGVPAIAIDPIAGGAKIARQVETIGWPVCFTGDRLDDQALQGAFDYCLSEEARLEARRCFHRAVEQLAALPQWLTSNLVEDSNQDGK